MFIVGKHFYERVQQRWIQSTLGAFLEPLGGKRDGAVYVCEQYSNDTELLQINLLTAFAGGSPGAFADNISFF